MTPTGSPRWPDAAEDSLVNAHTWASRCAGSRPIVAAKGGTVADITVGDCLELLRITEDFQRGPTPPSPYFYQLLRAAGMFGEAPRRRCGRCGPGPAELPSS